MGLDEWLRQGRLRQHRPSLQELEDLLGLADRSLADARVEGVSADGRFSAAYTAALSLATIPLCILGYRTRGTGHHALTFASLAETLGPDCAEFARYLNLCRSKRNETEYRRAGTIQEAAVAELIEVVTELRALVEAWLGERQSPPDAP